MSELDFTRPTVWATCAMLLAAMLVDVALRDRYAAGGGERDAPLGARFIEGRGRVFLSRLLYVSIVGQLVGALVLLPLTPTLVLFGLATFVAGVGVFLGVARPLRAASVQAAGVQTAPRGPEAP